VKIIEEPHIDYKVEVGIVAANYISNYKIQIIFGDRTEKVVDFENFISESQHPSIQKYRNKDLFMQFKITNGNLNWNEYELIFPLSDLKKGSIS
jgi:hypothetical protein